MGVNRSGYYKWRRRKGKPNRYEQDRILLTQMLEAEHKKYDPNTMEALMTDNDKDYEDEEVLEVLLKGYRLKDRVIRPASVRVNKLDEETENKEEKDNNDNKEGEDINE